MKRTVLPTEELLVWARLNGIECNHVGLETNLVSDGEVLRGAGLVATQDIDGTTGPQTLVSVPGDLILSREQILRYTAVDRNLKLILDATGTFGQAAPTIEIVELMAAGLKSPRGAILIFLLVQIIHASPEFKGQISVPNPHTDYIHLLPESVLLPTVYTEEEKRLLTGTSLRHAVDQKILSLETEFEQLQQYTQHIPWCQSYWWDGNGSEKVTLEDWKLVDALYRSRALDLPGSGHAMVPYVDMANHASGDQTVALYETDGDGCAVLQTMPGKSLAKGSEVTITYGDEKGASEMIFSYGFVESAMSNAKVLFLPLDIPDDDPLKLAKKRVNVAAPGVRLFLDRGASFQWESDYIWWSCINEEDGLDFRLVQQNDGGRQLEVLWKGERMDPSLLPTLLAADANWDIFRLRAVVMLQQRVAMQKAELTTDDEAFSDMRGLPAVRDAVWMLIQRLRNLERDLLSGMRQSLETQEIELLGCEVVQSYLKAAQADAEPPATDDFS